MHIVYLLQSTAFPEQRYVGYTTGLKSRLMKHNEGGVKSTARYKPWRVVTYLGFADEKSARAFEKYLKTGSGRAFANRHFWNQGSD